MPSPSVLLARVCAQPLGHPLAGGPPQQLHPAAAAGTLSAVLQLLPSLLGHAMQHLLRETPVPKPAGSLMSCRNLGCRQHGGGGQTWDGKADRHKGILVRMRQCASQRDLNICILGTSQDAPLLCPKVMHQAALFCYRAGGIQHHSISLNGDCTCRLP